MEEKTIFHKIRDREIPSEIVFEDDEALAFKDIHPKAPVHLLFIPKEFVQSIAHLTKEQEGIPGMLILKAKEFAAKQGIAGYKLTFHTGKDGGQEVPYLHLHFLAGQKI
jgi:histidine triad (HIT) family protein